jgi:hypothetical protein
MKAGFQEMDIDNANNTLQELGFEDGELEMFFYENPDVSSEQLEQIYLDISRREPFNLDWESVENAILAPYMTGAFKPNGTQFTKNDIAKAVLASFDDDIQDGGYKKRKRNPKKTKTKTKTKRRKPKKSNRRKTRRH